MYSFSFWRVCALLCISVIVTAQNRDSLPTYQYFDEIIISANKLPAPMHEVAGSVTVIDGDEIREKGISLLADAFKSEIGVEVINQGGYGKLTNMIIRGSNTGHVLVLIDGVEMNMPNDVTGVYDFANLPVNFIERVEILRGPQSALYGSDAVAGVVNIITKKPDASSQLFLSAEAGKYKTYKNHIGYKGSAGKLAYVLSVQRSETEGFSSASEDYGNFEKDGNKNWNSFINLQYPINNEFSAGASVRYSKARSEFDQFGGKFGDDSTYIYGTEEFVYKLQTDWKTKKVEVGFLASYLRNVRKYSFDETVNNSASSSSIYDGNRMKLELLGHYHFNQQNSLSAGVETETDRAVSEYIYTSPFWNSVSSFPNKKATTTGLFLQYRGNPHNNFFVTTGVRYDNHDRFGGKFTYRIAPAYYYEQSKTKIRFTYGTGFKTPSLFNLFDPAYGNQDLKPERSVSWDAGFDQGIIGDLLIAGVTYFSADYKDLFGFDPVTFKTININSAESKGWELYTNIKLLQNAVFKLHYTITYSKDKSTGSADYDKPLIRRPRDKAVLSISYNIITGLSLGIDLIYTGTKEDKDFSSFPVKRVTLRDDLQWNFSTVYDYKDFARAYLRIENILDRKREDILGYASPRFGMYFGVQLGLE